MTRTDTGASQHLCIVTGSSRGLGRGLVDTLRTRGDTRLLGLSRRTPDADVLPPPHEHWAVDLADPLPTSMRLHAWLLTLATRPWQTVTLINNAATLAKPGPLEDESLPTLSASMRVGLEAPTLLTAAFLHATQAWGARRRVLHISSGLARRAMAGSAAYCAVKAGLDHLARAQALDQSQRRERGLNAAAVVSLAPGVIDTDMQKTLRGADAQAFPERVRFKALAEQGMLDAPAATAQKILAYLEDPSFGTTAVADIRSP